MFRRNGKPTSCEPCRLAKVRCDHSTPTCKRCESRGLEYRCYYHPAPLTRAKRSKESPSSSRHSTKVAQTTTEREAQVIQAPAHASSLSSPGDVSDDRASTLFHGSTSYISAFHGENAKVVRAVCLLLTAEFDQWRTDRSHVIHRLIDLISSVAFIEEMVGNYYERGQFTVIPGPLVLTSISRVRSFIENRSADHGQPFSHDDLYAKITENTTEPLVVNQDMKLEEFISQFTGDRLRWEFVGFLLCLAGITVTVRYPHTATLDLYNGEQLNVKKFLIEMVVASYTCLEICKQNESPNDLLIWLRYFLVLLVMEVVGETSHLMYGLFGEVISDIFALGLHQQHTVGRNVPFFLQETRKRLLAVIHRTDKNLATLLGRPPRLPHNYCEVTPPLDLEDDSLFLDGERLSEALASLDMNGWNVEGLIGASHKFRPASVIRLRYILSRLREKALELSLGHRTEDFGRHLAHIHQECQRTWDTVPTHFCYQSRCWETMDPVACLVTVVVYLEYLLTVFQIQRIRSLEAQGGTKDMLDVALKVIMVVTDLLQQQHRGFVLRMQLAWVFLAYGIPAAGVLVTELRRHTLSGTPLPSSSPRSEIIRNLSVLISCFDKSRPSIPVTANLIASAEINQVISRILDETLNHELGAVPRSHNNNNHPRCEFDKAASEPPEIVSESGGIYRPKTAGGDFSNALGATPTTTTTTSAAAAAASFGSTSAAPPQTPLSLFARSNSSSHATGHNHQAEIDMGYQSFDFTTGEAFLSWLDGHDLDPTMPELLL